MENNFFVMSPDTNHTSDIIFGGKLLAEMDKIAFCEVLRFLEERESACKDAVTYMINDVKFHCPAYLGDIVYLNATVTGCREKSITVSVRGKVWRNEDRKTLQLCQGEFVFVSKKDGKPHTY